VVVRVGAGAWNNEVHFNMRIAAMRCGCSPASLIRVSVMLAMALPAMVSFWLMR
jgi:hypothetical protein